MSLMLFVLLDMLIEQQNKITTLRLSYARTAQLQHTRFDNQYSGPLSLLGPLNFQY